MLMTLNGLCPLMWIFREGRTVICELARLDCMSYVFTYSKRCTTCIVLSSRLLVFRPLASAIAGVASQSWSTVTPSISRMPRACVKLMAVSSLSRVPGIYTFTFCSRVAGSWIWTRVAGSGTCYVCSCFLVLLMFVDDFSGKSWSSCSSIPECT